ncbi:MAG: glycine cleavage system protein GcvH [Ignavibacteria bacterium]|nr:glycine cleavage system protein GcvH [Ignavibacteria bacterium]
MEIPEGLKYTKDHEWVKVEGDEGIIGITDYAQNELGDIIYLDITVSIGIDVKKGDTLGSIEAVKTVSDVYCPISGRLLDINLSINDNPSIVNGDPYSDGWIIKIEPSDKSELEDLLNASAYKELIGE